MASGKLGLLEYKFGVIFRKLKGVVTGIHPHTNLFHPQWVMDSSLLAYAKDKVSSIPRNSTVLDVGCGNAPYWFLNPDVNWVGLDIYPSKIAHHVMIADETFPIPSRSVDYILCTQVLEHVGNYNLLVEEFLRVLRPGGVVILNVPFLFPLHGLPHDYQRFTPASLEKLFSRFEISEVGSIGGFGSSIVTLLNNFWSDWTSSGLLQQVLGLALWPVSLLFNFVFNLLAKLIDRLDFTGRYALNFFLIAKKPIDG